MEKVPRVPSKSEASAKVRCQGEEKKLSSMKEELDKVWHAESRYLHTQKNRFILDRRRSMGNVYNSQAEGAQSRVHYRRRRRESAPEVIDIFLRQEERRRTVKDIADAVTDDVMRRLEQRYQEALGRDGSDADGEDSDSDEGESVMKKDASGAGLTDSLVPEQPDKNIDRSAAEKGEETSKHHNPLPHLPHQSKGGRYSIDTELLTKQSAGSGGSGGGGDGGDDGSGAGEEVKRKSRGGRQQTNKHSDNALGPNNPPQNHASGATAESTKPEISDEKKPSGEDDGQPKIPKRKRSYSDGNVTASILEFQNIQLHPYLLAKTAAAAQAALTTSYDHDCDSEEEEVDRRPAYRRIAFLEDGHYSSSPRDNHDTVHTPRDETFVIDNDVTLSPSLIQRGVAKIRQDLSSSSSSSSSQKQQQQRKTHPDRVRASQSPSRGNVVNRPHKVGDVTDRSVQSDVTTVRRSRRSGVNNSAPDLWEIRLSPSLKRRLAGVPKKDRKCPSYSDVTSSSPARSPRRQYLDVQQNLMSSPRVNRHQPTVAAASAAGVAESTESPILPRRRKEKPRPIYQQSDTGEKPGPAKTRPLRRSRSEAVDLTVLLKSKLQDSPRIARRGSDSIQVLGGAGSWNPNRSPRSWNSLLYGLALSTDEKEDIARHKRQELLTSLRKRQQEVDGDVSRRIQTFLQRYEKT